ncbi:very short patch repair endonuclease [Croceicoccus sp. YJ47]|uniref:very short patch repair endonuclease n=1 Tax=Croceicoccus sp. YJ47 TaxID=2798724 RepID=UPI0019214648|nr:DNA mismatch endonuclease Vsr [Croceicoccus sp. YJ47]QQN74704.1 DNA mismatch endonuclease Vsr [Croceicoccus sp. YJ47]
MADKLTPERRSENMRRIRSKDTKPELIVRRMLHGLGYRYRLHRRDLPGKPDLVFGPRRKVIFVHGCFWHQHAECREGRTPGSNTGYWAPKLARNVERDEAARIALDGMGWSSATVWECEIADLDALAARLRAFLDG